MSLPYDKIAPCDVTLKRLLDQNEYHSNYSSPLIIGLDEYHSNYSSSAIFKRPKFNENNDFSRSYDTSFPQNYEGQTWENSIHEPPFARIDPNHDFSSECVSIPSQFQYPNRDFPRGYDVSSQFYDPSSRKSEADSHGFKVWRNKSWKRESIGKNPTRNFSRNDFGSSRERSSKERPNTKIIPTGHLSRKYYSISPSSRGRTSENLKGTIGKMKPPCDFSRKSDSILPQFKRATNEELKDGSIVKVKPKCKFPRKDDSISPRSGKGTSEMAKDGSTAKVNPSCHISRKSDSISPRFQVGTSEKPKEGSIVKVNLKCDPVSQFQAKTGEGSTAKVNTKCDSVSRFQAKTSEKPKEGSVPKVNPTSHPSKRSDDMSLSPKSQPETRKDLKEIPLMKMKPTHCLKRNCDDNSHQVEIIASENSKEAPVVKASQNNPHEAKPSKVLESTKSTALQDNFKIRKVNASRQFSKQGGNLVSAKRDLLKVSEVSPSAVLKSDSTASVFLNGGISIKHGLKGDDDVRKVVKELKADDNIESIEPGLNDNIEGTMLKVVNENIEGVGPISSSRVLKSDSAASMLLNGGISIVPGLNDSIEDIMLKVVNEKIKGVEPVSKLDDKLKVDAVEELLKEAILPNDNEIVVNEPILSNDVDKVCTDPISTNARKKFPPRRKGFSAIRDWPLKFRTQKDQVFGPKNDVTPIGKQIQTGASLEAPKLSTDKPLECEEGKDKNQKQNGPIDTSDIQSSPIEKHHEKACAKEDVDMIGNSDLMLNQEKIESSTFLSEDTIAENHEHFNDLNMVPFEDRKPVSNRKQVKEVLDLYEKALEKLEKDNKAAKLSGKEKVSKQVHIDAAMILKKEKQWVNTKEILGHVSGVEVGDRFRFRAEIVCIGLHRNFRNGIDYIKEKDGKILAASIVSSGRYENDEESPDVLRYCGQGGNPKTGKNTQLEDQKLVRGNKALKNSMTAKTPVRVIRKNSSVLKYYYDGLYVVTKFTHERSQLGNMVYKFQLNRMVSSESNSTLLKMLLFSVEDISQGKEKIPINVVNTVDDEKIQYFNYITHMAYPDYCYREMCGCDCTDGCSDTKKCRCFMKNGGEVFDENGCIIIGPKSRRFIYECGSSCKCPPSCKNRVSQYGIRNQLEIFKTKSMGWGVRSRNFIPAGNFICEYVGELLQDQEAEQRSDNDEYLFDIDSYGYTIDAAKYGNVGRFINHSCSPNLYAQNVLFNHENKRIPHVIFFAVNGIFPFQELTYDYNYKVDSVRDGDGNIKKKVCRCGSKCCRERLY